MLFLVTGSQNELNAVARELGRVFLAGLHPAPVVALEIVRRFGGTREVWARSEEEAQAWRLAHCSTLSALPWRRARLSDGTEWRSETEVGAEVFLNLHRAGYVPTHCVPSRGNITQRRSYPA